MAQKDRYIKVKSDYTLKKKHKQLGSGTIYERDYMTISPMESLFAKDEYVLQDSNFKFSTRTGISLQKKHKRGNWIPNGVCSGEMETVWTVECMGSGATSDEGKIVLKPDYNSIKQFAYYGGAIQLVKASVNDIILNFPGEIYLTNEPLTLTKRFKEGDDVFVNYEPVGNLKYAKNDFGINIDYTNVNADEVYNPMRYFCLHAYDYVVESPNGDIQPVTSWTVTEAEGDSCEDNMVVATVIINDITLTVYRDNNTGDKRIGYAVASKAGTSIHPRQEVIEEYFAEKLDDFEKVLLSRDTNPIYTAKFITPRETDTGFTYMLKYYTWPVLYGYSPELESAAFDIYYNDLIQLAEFHDEWDSDNIWRSMTHEAIKNLDWTFVRDTGDGLEDMSIIDNSKIVPVLKIWGRNFDDIKRFIDNIKTCNTVSYNGKNNIPDYFLTDTLELGGWETRVLHLSSDNEERSPILYDGMSRGYNSPETDIEFFRRLKLNSHYILRSKGTRESFYQLLGLFGIDRHEFDITEHVAVAHSKGADKYKTGYATTPSNEGPSVTYPLASEVEAINKSRTGFYGRHGDDGFAGIPINVVSVSNDNGTTSYVIPWYRNGYNYDGGLYFQMNGGWCKRDDKDINLAIASGITKLLTDEELTIYDETETYLHFTDDIEGLKDLSTEDKHTGDICYVTDLTQLTNEYSFKDDDEKYYFENNLFSHYFYLENEDLSFAIGYSSGSSDYGWRNVLTQEIEYASSVAGKHVLYLESIENDTTANNPHVGRGYYDGGQEYLRRMGQIFHYGLENGEFGAYGQTECDEIADYGFNISGETDNKKCWYFGDLEVESGLTCLSGLSMSGANGSGYGDTNFEEVEMPECERVGYAENPEGGEITDEAAANSIINVKNVELTFYYPYCMSKELRPDYKKFVDNIVMFYLRQIIPSTTIFSYSVKAKQWTEEELAEYTCNGCTAPDTNDYSYPSAPSLPNPPAPVEPVEPDDGEIFTRYVLSPELVSPKDHNKIPARYRIYLKTMSGWTNTELSREDVTETCTLEWKPSNWPYQDTPQRSRGEVRDGIFYIYKDWDGPISLANAFDEWVAKYTKDGKEYKSGTMIIYLVGKDL